MRFDSILYGGSTEYTEHLKCIISYIRSTLVHDEILRHDTPSNYASVWEKNENRYQKLIDHRSRNGSYQSYHKTHCVKSHSYSAADFLTVIFEEKVCADFKPVQKNLHFSWIIATIRFFSLKRNLKHHFSNFG